MPVTIHDGNVTPGPVPGLVFTKEKHKILREACRAERNNCKELIQSSFDKGLEHEILPVSNGLVYTLRWAYSNHNHVVLRPDDFWNAIVTQFSFYVNAHAEELRGQFVAHEGKKELVVNYEGSTRYTVDWTDFTMRITHLLQENILDAELREWVLPAFSTTTSNDVAVASVVMMASMQKYFEYTGHMTCGLPSITLLGEKSDYELIYRRIEKLSTWGAEPTKFRNLLRPVFKRLIESFDDPTSDATIHFWSRVFKLHAYWSDSPEYSGWITAFCFWDEDGKCLYWEPAKHPTSETSEGPVNDPTSEEPEDEAKPRALYLDGVRYHKIDSDDVPSAVCSVPVKIIDNGPTYQAMMVAGSVGIACTSSGQTVVDESWVNGKKEKRSLVGLDTMQPQTGWFLFEREQGASRVQRKAGEYDSDDSGEVS
ncbi:hypothetical protein AMS68_005378 [Peltaster fructicola]|uniref:Uncharacterized protein n=1 Tax=Peltaster fructicola TaxID=286661 RepID=A0A6H0XYX0_9PEZI|nr:hypothetical protein AMS68_005378 [Peltaster fructicola]